MRPVRRSDGSGQSKLACVGGKMKQEGRMERINDSLRM